MSEDFHLEPLPADADTGDLLEALGPIDERPPESQYCVFRSRSESHHEDVRIGIAADEVIGTYSVNTEDLLEQAPENVPHCIGMLRHDDRLALVIDLRRLLEVFPGPSI